MSVVPEIGRHPLHLFQTNVFLFPRLLIIVQPPSSIATNVCYVIYIPVLATQIPVLATQRD